MHTRTSSNGDLGDLRIFHRVVRWNASGRDNSKPMMHDAKKSDPLIVPTKSTNNEGQPTAESMEGSGGIKRSAHLQSTVRAQSREAVSQAQARIHEIAKKHKGKRLTALLHHVNVDVLRWSFLRLKKDSAPGIDGVTWEQYAATDLEGNLQDLHRRVHTGA